MRMVANWDDDNLQAVMENNGQTESYRLYITSETWYKSRDGATTPGKYACFNTYFK